MKITVTENDIKAGIRRSPHCCPVARAMKRTLDKPVSIDQFTIFTFGASVFQDGRSYKMQLPSEVSKRVHMYDSGHGMNPFEFEAPDVMVASYTV